MNCRTLRSIALRWSPLCAVIGTCVISLILLRAELVQVPYLNDSAVHEEMVSFALSRIRSGHFPPDSWFPFLNVGSPQYLHYQSLGVMFTALIAWVIGVGRSFTVTTWLLVCCWPLCVYSAARIFGMRRGAALAAGLLSPFVSSATGVGFEQVSYLWSGYGLFSQLFAMWTLPFAWAFSWRAIDERRFTGLAAVFVGATAAFHFETGYLAFAAVAIFVFVRPSQIVRRAGRAGLVAAGALALSAWVVVPLIAQGQWAAVDQFLQGGPDADSYGARRILSWLFAGDLLDWHHLVLITPLLLIGLIGFLVAWRRPERPGPIGARATLALVAVFVCSLVLYFGRPTLGPLLDLLPGARDLFLRRFIVGVQLAGLLLAGVGAELAAKLMIAGAKRAFLAFDRAPDHIGAATGSLAVVILAITSLIPAWMFVSTQANLNAALISEQAATGEQSAQLDSIIATIKQLGGGRTFAGDPSDFGATFTVGEVPVFKYLASERVDEVGFTLRTASLMSDPEVEFDDAVPSDYAAFAVRFLVLPPSMSPPVSARRLEERGRYVLWEIPTNGYVEVVDTRGRVTATSSDLGSFAAPFLSSLPSADPVYPTVAYEGADSAPGTLPTLVTPSGPPGRVLFERADLSQGTVVAEVTLTRAAVVLLSASYDPGWQALVGGHRVPIEMVAPALVGARVGPGTHAVRFVYKGFPDYPQLFALGATGALGMAVIAVLTRRRRMRLAARSSHRRVLEPRRN